MESGEMARTFKASGARLELDTVRGEIRIIRDKNRVTKRHQLTDCTIPFSDITAKKRLIRQDAKENDSQNPSLSVAD